ncbi:SusC/RagA family TonB-linked outer membrane protein [Gynurincola endophyticus]|uniref:SusC/RagA family TonB-linked outer membrane protein n=1 Tax=Gynurincola endophyticus TaxID=2479004 RepID=UPI000F8C72FA|nr:SusC/RagA family TonB-linked outer membrane protein [Gynurincola endophyticus]
MRKLIYLLGCALWLWVPLNSFSQTRDISGSVKNSTGEPIPLATVLEKGTSNGVATNEMGVFNIKVNPNATLIVSYTGYKSKEVKTGTSNQINIILDETEDLEEVVVTALGITREKKALAYAAQSVSSDALNRNLQTNVVNALQGKIAGATISSVGGGPGQGATILIRGINSLDVGRDNGPLWVIDGVLIDNSTSEAGVGSGSNVRSVGNRASDINPEDIETINVLKGGAATALYGLRGANGVVVVTTKKGKSGRFNVNASANFGIETILKVPDQQMKYTAGLVGVYTPIGLGPAWGPTVEEAKLIDPTHPDKLYDNYKNAYRNGKQQRYSVNMTGGNENYNYFASLSSFNHEGMLPFTDYSNMSGRINSEIKLSSKLKANLSMNFINSGGYRYDADRFGESLAYFSPRWDVNDWQDENGIQVWTGTNNPIFGAATNKLKDNTNRFVGGLGFEYKPLSWLSLNYKLGIDTYHENRFRTAPGPRGLVGERVYDNLDGFVGDYNTSYMGLNSTFVANATFNLTDKIKTTVRVGQEVFDRDTRTTGELGSKLAIWDWFNLKNAETRVVTHDETRYRLMGIFGEATIDYDNILYLTVTGRNDITSTILKPDNSFFYPSFSLTYMLSDHITLPTAINMFKLRGSYAQIGKDARPYMVRSAYSSYTNLPEGVIGFTRGSVLGNPNLRPEFTNTWEGGFEAKFFNNRFGIDFTFYHSLSQDQILPIAVTSTTGYVTAAINAGSMRNKGVEIVLNATPVSTKNLTWETSLNWSANRNRVMSLTNDLTEITYASHGGYTVGGVVMKLVPGEAYGNIYGNYWKRYYGDKPEDPTRTDKSLPMVIGANGFPIVSDAADLKLLGNSQPRWIGGWNNTVYWKNFTFNALIDARWGFEKYNRLENFYSAFGLAGYTADRREWRVFDGVLADGTANTKPVWLDQGIGPDGVNYGEGYYRLYHRRLGEPFIQDASWIRLRSASVSYKLPSAWFKGNFVKNATVSLTGNNLILITDYFGLDPEAVSASSGSNVDGFSGFTYPSARSFFLTFNLGF